MGIYHNRWVNNNYEKYIFYLHKWRLENITHYREYMKTYMRNYRLKYKVKKYKQPKILPPKSITELKIEYKPIIINFD